MKNSLSLFSIALAVIALAGCKQNDDTSPSKPVYTGPKTEVIQLTTSFGDMYLWLYPGTPAHRENFIHLADSGFYDETEFHRNIDNFVIQGGDPLSKDGDRNNDGTGGPGYTIEAEIDSSQFKHKYGAIGAARLGNTVNPQRRSSGSQFYICLNPNGLSHLDGEYTVFGEVISGMDVAETIVSQPKNAKGLPDTRIKMTMKVLQMTAREIEDRFGFIAEF